jgi:hypothetical protein
MAPETVASRVFRIMHHLLELSVRLRGHGHQFFRNCQPELQTDVIAAGVAGVVEVA